MEKFIANGVKDFKWSSNPNQLEIECEEISDEYHSMHELYQHRMALTVALCNCLTEMEPDDIEVFRSLLHNDGTMFEGYFIIMIVIGDIGQVSYHYKLEHWNKFKNIFTVEKCPYSYDGHTSKDVIERLMKL